MSIKLAKHGKVDNLSRWYHNDIDINAWKQNKKVDTINKVLIRLVDLYLLPANKSKAPQERLYIQNTALSFEKHPKTKEVLYNITTRQVQRILVKLQELGVITEMNYIDADGNINKYNALNDKWDDLSGLTKRRIVLDIKRAKRFLSLTTSSKEYTEAANKSTIKRMITRRPFTLLDRVRDINNQIVDDIRQAKRIVNEYLEIQADKFGDFSDFTTGAKKVYDDAKKHLYAELYGIPDIQN